MCQLALKLFNVLEGKFKGDERLEKTLEAKFFQEDNYIIGTDP